MTWEAFRTEALERGFAGAYSVSPEPFPLWKAFRAPTGERFWGRLQDDPRALLPGARAVAVLVWAYRPYTAFPAGEPSVDAYYPASQSAFHACRALAARLTAQGYAADASQSIPAKWALLRTGEARYGRSGVTASIRFGTRVCIQTIVTDAPFPAVERTPEDEMDPLCAACGACMAACPTGAHEGNGLVSTERCLRAQPYAEAVPEWVRPVLGGSLIGCGICQEVCPRNSGIEGVAPPRALTDALRLERLLRGETNALGEWIGSNYARPSRVQGRAALLAANLGRSDLLPLLEELRDSHRMPYVREHARWAAEWLRERKA